MFIRSLLEEGALAFIDSPSHFIADVPAYYRGLRLLRTTKSPTQTTVHFEISADCALFVALPRGSHPPAASQHFVFQPMKFASVDHTISVYTAVSREVSRFAFGTPCAGRS